MAIVKISDLPLVDGPVQGTDLFVVVQDNVTKKAYASDIQTYVGFEEFQTATAGQTVFNLTTMTYAAGANNLQVFVDGVNQYVGSSYLETDNNTVTFTQGLHQGALVKFSTVQTQTSLVNSAGAVTFLQAGTGAVPRSVQSKERDIVSVKDFGAVGDGVTDDTAAIQAAVNAAEANRNNEIYFPVGNYVIAGTITIHGGIRLIGSGAMGAQVGQGVVLSHKANNVNMLVWDGNATNAAFGIGGGIFNIQCVKFSGYSGGDAIKLVATSDNYRPGEFTVENVLVWKGDGGVWSRGFHVDGTAANTPGSKGVRSIKIDKLRVGDCSENNQYIYLNQAVHVVSEYLQIDTGSGTGTCGMTVAGDSENIILNGLVLNGNLIIGGSSTMNVVLNGRVSVLDVNNTGVLGSANLQATSITNASTFFRIVSNVTDSFMVSVASTLSNVTGDGTNYPVTFDTEIFDSAGSFSGNTFTAKCAGRYLFTWCVGYTGLTSSHTRQDTGPVQKRSGVTIFSAAKVSNPYAQGANSGLNYSESGSIEMLLLEGDTVQLIANVSGGTKVVDILGAATTYTWFSGQYLP
jgi:hypothetical protein